MNVALFRSKSPAQDAEGQFVSILDLGTSCIRALVCQVRQGQATVLGVGRQPLGERAALPSVGGDAVAPEALASLCDLALRAAEDMTLALCGHKIVPDQAILGVGGDVLCSFRTAIQIARPHPDGRITEAEVATLLQRVERLAWRQIAETPVGGQATGPEGWTLVNAVVAEVQVDGQRVVDPLRFQGKTLQITVFHVFAPVAHRRALATLAADLELELIQLSAKPFAVARCLPVDQAIFLDVGADHTDVALVRDGGLAAIASLPYGGRQVSRQIAHRLGVSLTKAEELKIRWAQQERETPPRQASSVGRRAWGGAPPSPPPDPLKEALGDSLAAWLDGLEVLLADMVAEQPLPPRILLCGGASQLPEIITTLSAPVWARRLPFSRLPEVRLLPPREVRGLTDRTQRLIGPQDVPIMALAAQAAVAGHPETLQDRLLQESIGGHKMPYRR